jgi:hypothetical protein
MHSNITQATLTMPVSNPMTHHYYDSTMILVKPVVEELQNLHVASKGWAHQTVYSKYEEISSIAPRNGPPPRSSSDEMNISLNSL